MRGRERVGAGLRLLCKAGLAMAISVGSFFCANEVAHAQTQGHIAYVSDKDKNGNNPTGDDEIWIMNADGTNKVQLTFNTVQDRDPAITLDGSKIAFVQATNQTDGNGRPIDNLMTINSNGTGLTKLSWSNISPLGEINNPSWSPDNSRIIFSATTQYIDSMQNTYAYRYSNSDVVGIPIWANLPGANLQGWYQPSYSRDGTKVAYVYRTVQGPASPFMTYTTQHWIGTMTSIGGNMTNLKQVGLAQNQPLPLPIMAIRPSYSPDGSKILFLSQGMSPSGTYLVDANGTSGLARLAGGINPTFSPDGTNIAFESNGYIYSKPVSGGSSTELTLGRYPSWGG